MKYKRVQTATRFVATYECDASPKPFTLTNV